MRGLLPHGLAGVCALLLGPMQFSDPLRQRLTKFHGIVGSGPCSYRNDCLVLSSIFPSRSRHRASDTGIAPLASKHRHDEGSFRLGLAATSHAESKKEGRKVEAADAGPAMVIHLRN